jgi:5-methylcytosine-specific restriction protein B
MNTADRSVETLDSALRRRFTFFPVFPDTSILDRDINGVNLKKLMDNINEKIRYIKNEDYRIGQAWIQNCTDFKELKSAFWNKIIPLLQEYFYGDYGKIQGIIGDDFVKDIKRPEGLSENIPDYIRYEIIQYDNWKPEHFIKIYDSK